ncbi:MAG: oligoendopeptidase F [Desulfobacterales bacterium]|nr:oligoendopeptidase F [Desulfobacterales bacterium]
MAPQTIPERKDIPEDHKWNLTPLFASDEEWEQWVTEVDSQIDSYADYRGRLKDSADLLAAALDFHLSLRRKLEKIYTYAHLKSDEDKSNQFYLGLYQRAVSLHVRASESASFMTPEIQAIPDDRMQDFLVDDSLAAYTFHLEKILRTKPHTRSESVEQVLAMSQDMAQAPSQVFGQLDNVDLNFGHLDGENGKEIELSHGNFSTFLISPDRDLRKRAFFQYYQAYQDHQHTLAATLLHAIKKDLFYSRVRHFDSCRAAALFGDRVPDSVYDNLIETVRNNLAPLFRYLDFRKRALALSDLHFYDTYVPIVSDVTFNIPYEEAVDMGISALYPLGDEYASALKDGLLGGWVDRYENRGKRSGAYSAGSYDSPPYILLNYEAQDINSVYTLLHEGGHSMHSFYSNKHQPYVYHDYTIFVAEVASTFNENLLSRYLLGHYQNDPAKTAYILNREIDNLRATLFRQTMFAEFEKITHHIVEGGAPLTLDVMSDTYRELLETYFGDTMVLDPVLNLECLRIPHFYSAFYVYKYATGISAAIALADKVVAEGPPARAAYLNFLKLGGSKFPLDELLDAGVDMQSPEPIQRAIRYFSDLVDRLMAAYEAL